MPIKKLKSFLDARKVKYVNIRHSPAYTAQEIAHAAHITGHAIAKTVMVRIDGEMAMTVMPANEKVNLELLSKLTGGGDVRLATESEFGALFPDCELGAMPPFGNLWHMKVFASSTLRDEEKIAFNAGSHTELIQMDYLDYERLVKPTFLEFSTLVV